MEMIVHPAAWRCGCYVIYLVGVDSTKTRMIFIFLENTSNIPVDNGSSFNSFQAIVPYMGHEKGSFFYGGVSPSKIGLIAPY
jgi:hypothetical protein